MYALVEYRPSRAQWNKGKLTGQKPPLKLQEIWSIRIHLQLKQKSRDLALFNLAIDSKLRGCDLVKLKVSDIAHGTIVQPRAKIVQQKTQQPVQFEITDQTRQSLERWISDVALGASDYLFPSRINVTPHIHTPVRTDCGLLGAGDWARSSGIRNTLYAPYEGFTDLPPNEESTRSAVVTRSYEAGEYCAIPRYRSRRRARTGGAD